MTEKYHTVRVLVSDSEYHELMTFIKTNRLTKSEIFTKCLSDGLEKLKQTGIKQHFVFKVTERKTDFDENGQSDGNLQDIIGK